eukprot:3588481-Rhodomonas_salina.1
MTNWDVKFSMHPVQSGLFLYYITKSMNVPIARVPLSIVGKLCTLPVTDDEPAACFHASCGSMNLEELMHECMAYITFIALQAYASIWS